MTETFVTDEDKFVETCGTSLMNRKPKSVIKTIQNQSCAICGKALGDRTIHTRKKLMKCLFASNQSLVIALRNNDTLLEKIKVLENDQVVETSAG